MALVPTLKVVRIMTTKFKEVSKPFAWMFVTLSDLIKFRYKDVPQSTQWRIKGQSGEAQSSIISPANQGAVYREL